MDPINVLGKFDMPIASTVTEIIAIAVLGFFWVGLRTPNLGEGKAVGGRGWYRSKERL